MAELQKKSDSIIEEIRKNGIIPVIKIQNAKHALPLARAIVQGGFSALEITFRTDAAEEAITTIRTAFPDLLILAGTVLNPELAQKAVSAGANALVSPGFNKETVLWAKEHTVPIFPGVATPSEVETALMHDLSVLKLFPAEVFGGTKLLQSLAGPFAHIRFIPTGGITLENTPAYLAQKNVLAIGGTWLTPAEYIQNENWALITQKCAEAKALVAQVRANAQ